MAEALDVATPATVPQRRAAAWDYLPLLILVAGVVVRLIRYAANRSLWLDEAMLAMNIPWRSFKELTEPLDYNQGAPIGFLMTVKLTTLAFGLSEYALRLVPLLCGIASLILFYLVARRLLAGTGRMPLAVAMALFAFAEPLVYYSAELKQYSSDVAMCLLIMLLALRAAPEGHRPARRRDVLALVGAIALWFSHAVTFMLAGVGVWLLILAITRNGHPSTSSSSARSTGDRAARRDILATLGMGALWLVSFAAHYFMALKGLAANHYLLDYWQGYFVPLPPRSLGDLGWYLATPYHILRDIVATPWLPETSPAARWLVQGLVVIAAIVAILGLLRLWRQDRRAMGLLLLPIGFLAIASALHRYPMHGRLVLFLLPLVMLLIAQGMAQVRSDLASPAPATVAVRFGLMALVLLGPVSTGVYYAFRPPGHDEIRDVLAYVARHKGGAEAVYFLGGAQAPARYYAQAFPATYSYRPMIPLWGPWEVWSSKYPSLNEYEEYRKVSPLDQVWIITSDTAYWGYRDQERRAVALFDQHGRRLDEIHTTGAAAYRYDLSEPAGAAEPRRTNDEARMTNQ